MQIRVGNETHCQSGGPPAFVRFRAFPASGRGRGGVAPCEPNVFKNAHCPMAPGRSLQIALEGAGRSALATPNPSRLILFWALQALQGGGGGAQGLGIRLFALGGAHWPLATAHSDPLWARL